MYNVSATVLEKLKAVFILQSKLSEYIFVYDTVNGLEFAAKNSSSTVSARAFFSQYLFENFKSTNKVYCISSSALDKIFASIPHDFAEFTMGFRDKVYLEIVQKKVHRTHEIDLINAPETERGAREITGANAYIIRVDMLREVLTHFSSAAEIAELYIETGESVRWRGYRSPQRAGKTEIFTKIDSTAMMHFTDMFVGLRVDAPWRSEFLLKELRYANSFFEKVCKDKSNQIICLFDDPGSPMRLCCQGQYEAFSIQFDTMAKPVPNDGTQNFTWQYTPDSILMDISCGIDPNSEETVPPQEEEIQQGDSQEESQDAVFVIPTAKRPRIVESCESGVNSLAEDSIQNEETVAMAFPLAEIQSTQQERVPGLFD